MINILGGADIAYTLYQVVYATAIGFFFAMIYFKTKNLWIPILIHGLIDWSDFFFNLVGDPAMNGFQWAPILLTIIYLIYGIILYQKIDTDDGFENLATK